MKYPSFLGLILLASSLSLYASSKIEYLEEEKKKENLRVIVIHLLNHLKGSRSMLIL